MTRPSLPFLHPSCMVCTLALLGLIELSLRTETIVGFGLTGEPFGLCLTLETKLLVFGRRYRMRAAILVLLCILVLGCRTNESPEGQVDDLQITAQVKSKLASDVGISSVTNISVNSTNGVVTLSGQVDSSDVKTKAETVAKNVPKVVRVVDTLQVSPKT